VLRPVGETVLEEAVIAQLDSDPRLPDSLEIAVQAADGRATLRGRVESFGQRRAAVSDARKTTGVEEVDDQLQVDLLRSSRRPDNELRGEILQRMIWDADVPDEDIEVKVDEAWVTLSGTVQHQFESDAAYEEAARHAGVTGVTNKIEVISF
jgi:osmotically-inducible protein OsmY